VGGQVPPEIKVGGLGPCGPPVPPPMMQEEGHYVAYVLKDVEV